MDDTIAPMEQPATVEIVPDWSLGDRLRKSLDVAGIGVSDMAEVLGYTRDSVGRWIHDRGVPRKATMRAWAAITGVSLEWLETGARSEGFEPPTF